MAARLLSRLPHIGAASAFGLGTYGFLSQPSFAEEAKQPEAALRADEWRSFKVVEKRELARNKQTGIATEYLRFQLPHENMPLGLPVASCFVTRAPIGSENEDGSKKNVIRPYTPVTSPDEPEPIGHFDLIVKVYPEGKMSKHIGSLKVGDELDVKGPISKFAVAPNMKKNIGMIAGGSGLTPMLQVASQILSDPEDKTQVSLIYANQSEDDIILKDKLDQMQKDHSNFKVHYVIDKPIHPEDWRGSIGYIDEKVVKAHLPPAEDENLILVCGPPPMMMAISGDKAKDKSQGELSGLLKKLGYTTDQVYKF